MIYYDISYFCVDYQGWKMSKIILKTANRPTSVPRHEIEEAVRNAYIHFGYINGTSHSPRKKAAKKAAKKK